MCECVNSWNNLYVNIRWMNERKWRLTLLPDIWPCYLTKLNWDPIVNDTLMRQLTVYIYYPVEFISISYPIVRKAFFCRHPIWIGQERVQLYLNGVMRNNRINTEPSNPKTIYTQWTNLVCLKWPSVLSFICPSTWRFDFTC